MVLILRSALLRASRRMKARGLALRDAASRLLRVRVRERK